jgi:hypothetical protein
MRIQAPPEEGASPGDVDVLLVGRPDRDEVFDAEQRAERRLGRPVHATVVSESRWVAAEQPFLQQVKRRPVVRLEGGET